MNDIVPPPRRLRLALSDSGLAEDRRPIGAGANAGLSGESDEMPPFLEQWRAVMVRKWAVLALTLIATAVAAFVVMQLPRTWTAAATALIEVPRPRISSPDDLYGASSPNREFLQTQAEVMRSRELLGRVSKRLSLDTRAGFDPRQDTAAPWRLWLRERMPSLERVFDTPASALDQRDIDEAVVSRLYRGLETEVVRNSQLVRVRFTGSDPVLAADVANTVMREYIAQELEKRASVGQSADQWIDQRLRELRARVEASERALQSFREREGVVDTKGTGGGAGRDYADFSQRLVDARVRTAMAKEALDQMRAAGLGNYDNVPAVNRSPGVQAALQVQANAEKALAAVNLRYGPDHPRFAAATTEVNEARNAVRREVRLVFDAVEKEYSTARALQKTIEDALEKSRGDVQSVNRKEARLAQLERDAASDRQVYENFLARFKQAGASPAVPESSVTGTRFIDAAQPPAFPSGPKRVEIVLVTFAVALAMCIFGAVLLSRLDNTVKTSLDVERKLHVPFLASLPSLRWGAARDIGRAQIDRPDEVFSESVRTIATGVMLSAIDTDHKVVVVTSSLPDEGKTTVSTNLALALAHSRRVLLLDADLRRPSVARALGVESSGLGLSELISGAATEGEVIRQVDGTELGVVLAGRLPPNPLELLASKRFQQVIAQLSATYDVIVIDSPPLQLVSDALVIGVHADGLVQVVKADRTPAPLVRAALKRIAGAGIPIFGVVLNQQNFRKAERYYGEYSGYGKYGYGKYGYGKAYSRADG